MTTVCNTMLDIIRAGKDQEDPTVNQYATNLERMFNKRGYKHRHLDTLEGSLEAYIGVAPKYKKGNAALNSKIKSWGISPATYRQYQTDGRRMIEFFSGELQKRNERRKTQDGFARLLQILPDLVDANLLKASQTRNLPRLIDFARARGYDMSDMVRDRVIDLREDCVCSDVWGRVKLAAGVLDYLRQFPTCLPLLPPEEIGSLAGVLRIETNIPSFLQEEAQIWVQNATVVYHHDMLTLEARDATAQQYSESSKGVYTAALRAYIREIATDSDLETVNGLTSLFSLDLIEKTLVRLCKKTGGSGGLAPRSLFSYAVCLKLILSSRGLENESAKVEKLIKSLPALIEGQAASKIMSPKVEEFCRNLLNSPIAIQTFESQHFSYAEKAVAAIEMAKIEGIDLLAYSRSPKTQPLSRDQLRLAVSLLRQARMYGVCAAFAAIELEGAPFRKSNVIDDLKFAGHPQTFFDHQADKQRPRIEIFMPNELLKNGDAMTARNQYLPRFIFEQNGLGSDAYRILSFFLARIRPLFGGADHSDHLFPKIEPEPGALVISTFDGWLAECSDKIGLFLLPHNFRHGLCTIEIFHDPTCYAALETLTGDTEKTLRQHYAFIDRERQSRSLQEKRYERRAQRATLSVKVTKAVV